MRSVMLAVTLLCATLASTCAEQAVDYSIGALMAENLKRLKPSGGSLCIQLGSPTSGAYNNRAAGFRDAIADRADVVRLAGEGGWTEIDGCPVFSGEDTKLAVQLLSDILAANPDVDALILTGGWAQADAAEYRSVLAPDGERVSTGDLVIIGGDAEPKQRAALAKGLSSVQIAAVDGEAEKFLECTSTNVDAGCAVVTTGKPSSGHVAEAPAEPKGGHVDQTAKPKLPPMRPDEKRVALVIGNSAYAEAGALANPKNDAELMAQTLQLVGFTVTKLIDADQAAMKRAMLDFGRTLRAGADAGLFYYAGHGVQVKGENFLIPVDAALRDEAEVDLQAINVNDFLAVMEGSASKVNIVILDACRNNPFARSFRSASRGLAMVDAPEGSYVAFATAPGQVAADGDGANSPYTKALAAAMVEPGVKLEDTFKKARRIVIEATARQQVPWETTSVTGDFYFVSGDAAADAARKPAAPTETPKDIAVLPPQKPAPPAEAPGVFAMGKAGLPQTFLFDFDRGAVQEDGGDLWFQAATEDDLYLTPQNGAMLAAGDYSKRDAFQCRDASYSAERLPLKPIPKGAFICVTTSEGRIGSFRIDAMTRTSPRTLSINYAVWDMAAGETKVAALSGGAEGKSSPRSLPINACDRLAALILDGDKPVELRGVIQPPKAPEAVAACQEAVAKHPGVPRFVSQLAMALWGAGDEAGARKLFAEAAAGGHAAGFFGLAILEGRGVGGEPDEASALSRMRQAEAAGYIVATIALGETYGRGNAVLPKDPAMASEFGRRARAGLEAAIAAGDPDAPAMLAQSLAAEPDKPVDAEQLGGYLLDGLAKQSRVAIALLDDASIVDKLTKPDRQTVERFLADYGLDPGPVDGVIDEATRGALEAWEKFSIPATTAKQ